MRKINISIYFFILVIILLSTGCVSLKEAMEADKAFFSGNYDEAIEYYQKQDPKDKYAGPNSRYMMGVAYYKKGDYKSAISTFEYAIKTCKEINCATWGTLPAWYFWLGKAYYDTKQYEKAAQNFSIAASIAEEKPTPPYDSETWRNWFSLVPPKSSCYFWLGNAYYAMDNYIEAKNAYEKSIEIDPSGSSDLYSSLAMTYGKLRDYDKALSAAKNAISIKPTSAFAYVALGLIYLDTKEIKEALTAFKKAIELDPKFLPAYKKISNIYDLQENYTEMVNLWQKAASVNPNWLYAYDWLASAYTKAGKYNDAIVSLNKAIELATITGIGTRISIEENYPVVKGVDESGPAKRAGVEVGDKIVRINDQSTKGWDGNKVAQNVRGAEGTQVKLTIERGDKDLKKIITREKIIQKEAANPFGRRSQVYAAMGNLEQSFKDAEMAYSLDPNDSNAKTAISLAFIQKGNPDEALKILSSSKNDFDKLLLSFAYAKKGDFERSVEIYKDIPEDYLSSKSVFRQDFRKMVLQSMKPYIQEKRKQAETLEAKGKYKEALKEYGDLIKFLDEKETKEIRAHIATLLKEKPYLLELPEEARKRAIRAEEYTKEGKFEEAVNKYKKALKIAPFHPDLYKALALNYGGMKQYSKAIDSMKIYLELYPDAPDARVAKDEIYRWEIQMEKEGK